MWVKIQTASVMHYNTTPELLGLEVGDCCMVKPNPANQENWPSVGTIASTLAQYSAIYGNTLGQFSWFVGKVFYSKYIVKYPYLTVASSSVGILTSKNCMLIAIPNPQSCVIKCLYMKMRIKYLRKTSWQQIKIARNTQLSSTVASGCLKIAYISSKISQKDDDFPPNSKDNNKFNKNKKYAFSSL